MKIMHVIYFALIALRGFLHQYGNCLHARAYVVYGVGAASQRILLGLPRLLGAIFTVHISAAYIILYWNGQLVWTPALGLYTGMDN